MMRNLVFGLLVIGSLASQAASQSQRACERQASAGCYFGLTLLSASGRPGQLHYYASRRPDAGSAAAGPRSALVAVHGHPRDANKTFDAALLAVQRADRLADTLVVAPVFQVAPGADRKCRTAGVPPAAPGDLLWTCGSWLEGGRADEGAGPGAFAAMDALVAELQRRWPSVRSVTIAGFSAGAQMVQHYVGFAAAPPTGGATLRFVVADPGTWLYFDPLPEALSGDASASAVESTATAPAGACPELNRWKYGTEGLPAHLGRSAAQARSQYAQADISYLEGELDDGDRPGSFYRILDKSCAAMAQGSFRRQRGEAYALYDRTRLAPTRQRRVVVVPGCKHDVACVFPSPAARAALLGPPR